MHAAAAAARSLRVVAELCLRVQHKGHAMIRDRRSVSGAAWAAFAALLLLLVPGPAAAELRIDITRGKVEPMPIAIPAFAGGGGAESVGRDMAQVVSADLESSGLF